MEDEIVSNIVFKDDNVPQEFTTPAAIVRIWSSCTNKTKCPDLNIWPHKSEGHVSLELIRKNSDGIFCRGTFDTGTYISAEPNNDDDCVDLFKAYPVHYVPSYQHDLSHHYLDNDKYYEGEGQEPDKTVVLYDLDVDEMVKRFEDFKSSNRQNWTMFVPHLSLGKCQNGQSTNINCVTLVLAILKTGGFYKLQGVLDKMVALGIESPKSIRRTEADWLGSRICNGLWHGLKFICSPLLLSPDVFTNLVVSAKKHELESLAEKKNFLITFINDSVSVVDWDEIERLKNNQTQKYKELKHMPAKARLGYLPRKTAKVTEWVPSGWKNYHLKNSHRK